MTSAPLLRTDAAIAYWDGRHQRQDDLRSGGHIGMDHAANELFYALRLGRLIDVLGDLTSPREPLFVLDAGCGKGWFSRAVARFGHRVDAIDASPSAVEDARKAAGGPRYEVSTLSAWSNPWLYDVVYAVDVLFHILDDSEWQASLENLASLVRLGGLLVVADEDRAEQRQLGDYIVHRARSDYLAVTDRCGLRHVDFVPYGFRDNLIGFHVFLKDH